MPLPKSFVPEDQESSIPSSFVPLDEEKPKKEGFLKIAGKVLESLSTPLPKHHQDEEVKKEESSSFDKLGHKISELAIEHPVARERLQRFFTGTSPEQEEYFKSKGINPHLQGPELSEIPGAKSVAESIRTKGRETGSYSGGFAGSILGDLVDFASTGFDPRTAGIKRPISSVEKPYRFQGYLPLEKSSAAEPEMTTHELSLRRTRELPPDLIQPHEEDLFNRGKIEEAIKPTENTIYEQARNKFNMGKELPSSFVSEEVKPTATFKGMQETGDPRNPSMALFDIEGGPNHGSTVSQERLQELGIDVPKYEVPTEKLSGDELRKRALAERASKEEPKKSFVNPFEKKVSEEVPKSFVPESEVKIPELVSEGAPPIRQKTGNFWIDDANRMKDAALSRRSDPIQAAEDKAKLDKWNDMQENLRVTSALEKKLGYDTVQNMPKDEWHKLHNKTKLEMRGTGGAKIPKSFIPEIEGKIGPDANKTPKELLDEVTSREKPSAILENLSEEDLNSHIEEAKKNGLHVTENPIVPNEPIISKDPQTGSDLAKSLSEGNHEETGRLLGYSPEDIKTFSENLPQTEEPKTLAERLKSESGVLRISKKAKEVPPNEGPYATALDKLFNAMGNLSEKRVEQDIINRKERAERFAKFESVTDTGRKGAAQSLSKLKGEFDNVDVDKLKLGRKETDALFTAVKEAKITTGEKARGYTTLFKLLNGELPQRNELRLLDDVFGSGFAEKVLHMHGGLGSVGLNIGKTANTMKALRSSIDLSAPLRQGIGLIHRPEYREAFKEMFKYLAKPEYYKAAMEGLEERPLHLLGRESGLFLAKPDNLLSGEEAFLNNYLHNLPKISGIPVVVDASERAYTGFLNNLRANTFDNLIKLAKESGAEPFTTKREFVVNTEDMKAINELKKRAEKLDIPNHLDDPEFIDFAHKNGLTKTITTTTPTKVAENIAKYVNVSTGRGGLGKLEKYANDLNTIIWSPRFISSRLSILNPKYYTKMDPFTRKEAIKSLFAIAAAGSIVTTLGTIAGGKTSFNSLSSDFGKARFGNNVLDPWAGFQQPIVAASRLIEGSNASRPQTRTTTLENFGANKLSPMASLAYELASAKAFTGGGNYVSRYGQKKYIPTEIMNSFMPMFIQDVTDVFKNDPSFAEELGLDTASLFGMGVQNYAESTNKPLKMRGFNSLKP